MACKLHIILAERRIQLKELAEITGLDLSYLSNVKNEYIKSPGVYQAIKISNALGVPIKEIWTIDEEKPV